MKVYDKIVIDIASGNIIEARSFNYTGPIAKLNSKKPKAVQAAPTQQSQAEIDLMAQQSQALQQQKSIIDEQMRMQDLLSPILYKSAGITPITAGDRLAKAKSDLEAARSSTKDGAQEWAASLEKDIAALEANPQDPNQIVGFSGTDAAAADPEAARIEQLLQERSLAALEGKLPVDPTLLSELDKQEKTLRETLLKQLGPGYETSTPGQDTLAKFQKSKAELLSSASRGDLTLAEQLGISREQANQQTMGNIISRVAGINSLPLNTAGAYGSNAAGYNTLGSLFQSDRQMQNQMNMFNAQQRNMLNASGGGGGGAGMASGILGGGLQGAGAGAMFGPWGAAIGGVAGMAMGGLSSKAKG